MGQKDKYRNQLKNISVFLIISNITLTVCVNVIDLSTDFSCEGHKLMKKEKVNIWTIVVASTENIIGLFNIYEGPYIFSVIQLVSSSNSVLRGAVISTLS